MIAVDCDVKVPIKFNQGIGFGNPFTLTYKYDSVEAVMREFRKKNQIKILHMRKKCYTDNTDCKVSMFPP